jgi:hypothetical protein
MLRDYLYINQVLQKTEIPAWHGERHSVIVENRFHAKLVPNQGTSPEFKDGEHQNNKTLMPLAKTLSIKRPSPEIKQYYENYTFVFACVLLNSMYLLSANSWIRSVYFLIHLTPDTTRHKYIVLVGTTVQQKQSDHAHSTTYVWLFVHSLSLSHTHSRSSSSLTLNDFSIFSFSFLSVLFFSSLPLFLNE